MISQEAIDEVWGNANFGNRFSRIDVVKLAVLKCASGFYQGSTSRAIQMIVLEVDSDKREATVTL